LNIQVSKVHVLDIQVSKVHILVLQEMDVVHVLEDQVTNVNETMKVSRNFNTNKDKLK
jgi:hypothetical protein